MSQNCVRFSRLHQGACLKRMSWSFGFMIFNGKFSENGPFVIRSLFLLFFSPVWSQHEYLSPCWSVFWVCKNVLHVNSYQRTLDWKKPVYHHVLSTLFPYPLRFFFSHQSSLLILEAVWYQSFMFPCPKFHLSGNDGRGGICFWWCDFIRLV